MIQISCGISILTWKRWHWAMGEARGRGDEKSKSVDASYHTTYK
jgi:hypothetical protein